MGVSAKLEVYTRSLGTIQIIWLMVENYGIAILIHRIILKLFATHIGAVITTNDCDATIYLSHRVDKLSDTCILKELLRLWITCIILVIA